MVSASRPVRSARRCSGSRRPAARSGTPAAPAVSARVDVPAQAGQPPRPSRRGLRAAFAALALALAVPLAGCGDSENDQPTTRPAPAPQPRPAPAPTSVPTPDEPAAAPSGEPGSPSEPGAAGGAAGPPGSGSPDPAGTSTPTPVIIQPSPVFVGEACSPQRDVYPAYAINGLVLYCVPSEEGPVGSLGRWSAEPPQPQQPQQPESGAVCDPEDVGRIVQDAEGRPVACMREPNGELRWADVS